MRVSPGPQVSEDGRLAGLAGAALGETLTRTGTLQSGPVVGLNFSHAHTVRCVTAGLRHAVCGIREDDRCVGRTYTAGPKVGGGLLSGREPGRCRRYR